jgi:glucose-1-phosphate cytidylyltransferase
MKAVILAGGMGTRMREETEFRPKPMVEIGGKPVLWHIMQILGSQGISEFIIATGYKSEIITNYFLNFPYWNSKFSLTLDKPGSVKALCDAAVSPWKVTVAFTGLDTNTGGRVKLLEQELADGPFLITYGDGLADVNLNELLAQHNRNKSWLTISTANPSSRFGVVHRDPITGLVQGFAEKSVSKELVNIGYMIAEPEFLKILGENSVLETDPLQKLVQMGKLSAYIHSGFWQPMDTYREYLELNKLWNEDSAPWKNW